MDPFRGEPFMTIPVRLGILPYLNTRPLLSALADELSAAGIGAETTAAPPAALAAAFDAGALDASFVSAGSLPSLRGAAVLPTACVAADGPVRSVILFSDRPLAALDGSRVLVGADTVASVRLLDALARERHGARLRLEVDRDGAHLSPGFRDPVLLIGDACLRYALAAPHPVRVDLAELWREHTGLPMVFALVALAPDFHANRKPEAAALARAIDRASRAARERAAALPPALAAETGFPAALLSDYFDHLAWRLTPRMAEGCARYHDTLARHGHGRPGFRPAWFGGEPR